MQRIFKTALLFPLMTLSVWATPTDQQVLDLYKLWNDTLAVATDFQAVAPLMSDASRQRIARMEVGKQRAVFAMMKMSLALNAGVKWTVEGHQREKGFLIYKLVHQDKTVSGSTGGSTEFPVAEEEGLLKVDYGQK